MRIERKYKDLSFEEFVEDPSAFVEKASQTTITVGRVYPMVVPGTDYEIKAKAKSGELAYFVLTGAFRFNSSIKVKGEDDKAVLPDASHIENLQRYKNNPTARSKAIDRVFDRATKGEVVGVKIECKPGVNRTAFIHRADMNG